eukprot:TRINITY_DN12551_c0_g1_i1.p1 TRINITY_DN12551_c0_g1~~TRINITY_DN12551_c0_g1_i1.p1  ORF type:complete len:434 (+),score=86.22 TRINITY_DN12551_c0_g1_i1:28-1329(+)
MLRSLVTLIALSCLLTSVIAQTGECTEAEYTCNEENCKAPDCRCSGTEPTPEAKDRPQLIYLTYDDAFTAYAEENFYSGLYKSSLKNPDGNPIRATHFLCASFTDYSLVNEYYQMGHEMASHSITHKTPEGQWADLSVEEWTKEAVGMRSMISQFANIPQDDIKGFRAPFLRMGGDNMYKAFYDAGFTYDCSWVSRDYGYHHLDDGLFPYTMDKRSVQDCEVEPCPICSYPGFWVQPILDLEDSWFGSNPLHPDWGQPCSMLDGCVIIEENPTNATAYEMIMRNFNQTYNGNRAPFGLYMHAAWFFGQDWHYEGYKMFLEEVLQKDDVWIVTISEGLNFYANHSDTTNAQLLEMNDAESPFGLGQYEYRKDRECRAKDPCQFKVEGIPEIPDGEERYMKICGKTAGSFSQNCPSQYPWIGNPCGGNQPCNGAK